jgi:protein PhnA
MTADTKCPKCVSENIYFDGSLWICPECNFETVSLSPQADTASTDSENSVIKDAFGSALSDGDAVTVIKDLKIKGSSASVKVGTKVKNIRLIDASDGHNIACKIDGFGAMNLKSEFVKKA